MSNEANTVPAPAQEVNAGDNQTTQQASTPAPAQPAPPAVMPQSDVQAFVTRESRKALEKLLKDAGITPGDNPEMQLRDYKKWLDTQKTDLQRAQESAQTLTGERDAAVAEVAVMKSTLTALQKGVPADKTALYIKMTELHTAGGMSFDDALDAVLKEFPIAAPAAAPKEPLPQIVLPASTPNDAKAAPYKPPRVI